MKLTTIFFAAVLTSQLMGQLASAFEVDHNIIQMAPAGDDIKKVIILKNKEKYKKLVQVEVFERQFEQKEKEPKQSELIDVSHKTVLLEPSSEFQVTLTWKGSADLKKDSAFRVVFTEIKKDKENASTLQEPLMKYVTSVFVTPAGYKDDIFVVKSDVKKRTLALTLRNKGKKHKLFLGTALLLQDGKTKETFMTISESEALQQTLIMPGQTKTVEITLDQEPKNKSFKVSFVENEAK